MKTKIEKDLGMCDQKEREFMEELYRKYERLMYATVRRYISDSMEQEEIVQESLKKLIEKRRVLCNLDCAAQAGYIVVAIRNTSFSYLRKRNRERSKIISLETLNEEGMRHIILAEEEQLFYEEEIEKLKEKEIKVYAAHLEGKTFYDEEDYREGCAFLIGNEGNGLREEVAACAGCRVRIPMEGQAESLNAAVASAVLMYEVSRQRRRQE